MLKEKIVSFRALDGSEKEIDDKNDLEDYLDQICSVFDFLGQATQAKIRDAAESSFPYTFDADFGHYLVFTMAINELRKFGELVGCHTETTRAKERTEAIGG